MFKKDLLRVVFHPKITKNLFFIHSCNKTEARRKKNIKKMESPSLTRKEAQVVRIKFELSFYML